MNHYAKINHFIPCRKIIYFLRGILALMLITLSTQLLALLIILLVGTAKIVPKKIHSYLMSLALECSRFWGLTIRFIVKMNIRRKLNIHGEGDLDRKAWYIIISNHQSWADIVLLIIVFCRDISLLKFFLKKELLWQLPLAGIACYLLDYPMLAKKKHLATQKRAELKRQNIKIIKEACNKLQAFPAGFVNFSESTRFTKEKHQHQSFPYKYLLKPKASGISSVLAEMPNKITAIINTTIHYYYEQGEGKKIFWDLLCGKIDKIYVHYEVIRVTPEFIGFSYEDREYRKRIQQWLNDIWSKKDQLIEQFHDKK